MYPKSRKAANWVSEIRYKAPLWILLLFLNKVRGSEGGAWEWRIGYHEGKDFFLAWTLQSWQYCIFMPMCVILDKELHCPKAQVSLPKPVLMVKPAESTSCTVRTFEWILWQLYDCIKSDLTSFIACRPTDECIGDSAKVCGGELKRPQFIWFGPSNLLDGLDRWNWAVIKGQTRTNKNQ